MITDRRGFLVARVRRGKTADLSSPMPEVEQLREAFGIERIVFVAERGMIAKKAVLRNRELEAAPKATADRFV